ncbi:MAG: Omp28-related outer membrane protein [Crocinitomicaceae bacterium]
MKKIAILLILTLTIFQFSCDKVEQPGIPITELDVTLFPGDFFDYVVPVFDENTNTERNVLIEDFTGHKCTFCPAANTEAAAIETNNPGRAFVISIHAAPGPGGTSPFQAVSPTGEKFTTDFTTPEGKEIAEHLSEVQGGVEGNPTGAVSRVKNAIGQVLIKANTWADATDTILNNPSLFPLLVNIQAKSNYYPETNGIFIHTEVDFLKATSGEYAIVVYAIQDKIIDWQLNGSATEENYEHHNVHIGNVFEGESFGRVLVNDEVKAGEKFYNDFSYKIPEGLDGTKMHFQIYVYDKATEEILQVIEHRF